MKQCLALFLALLSYATVLPPLAIPEARKIQVGQNITKDPYVDVRAYLAVGDGTDDSSFVQLAATAATGGTLFIPANITLSVKNISIPANTRVTGGGTLKLFALKGTDNSPILFIAGDNVVIDGITLDGNKAAHNAAGFSDSYDTGPNGTGRAFRAAIRADGTGDGLIVRNCLIKNTYGAGVATRNVEKVSVIGNRFESNNFESVFIYSLNNRTYSGGSGHQIIGNKSYNVGSGHATVNGNAYIVSGVGSAIVDGNYAENTERDLVKIEISKNVTVSKNIGITNSKGYAGIQTQGSSPPLSNIVIEGNKIRDFGIGILIGGTVDGLVIANNILSDLDSPSTPDGIAQDGSLTNAVIKGNVIKNAGRFGLWLQQLSKNILIDGNLIVGGGTSGIGLIATDNTATVSIKNNVFQDIGGTANDAGVIYLPATNRHVFALLDVSFNTILTKSGATGRGIYWAKRGVFSKAIIHGNYIDGTLEVNDETAVAFNNYVTGAVVAGEALKNPHQWNNKQKIVYDNAAPATGTWTQGDIVWNTGTDNVVLWKCTATGTPGTWTSLSIP